MYGAYWEFERRQKRRNTYDREKKSISLSQKGKIRSRFKISWQKLEITERACLLFAINFWACNECDLNKITCNNYLFFEQESNSIHSSFVSWAPKISSNSHDPRIGFCAATQSKLSQVENCGLSVLFRLHSPLLLCIAALPSTILYITQFCAKRRKRPLPISANFEWIENEQTHRCFESNYLLFIVGTCFGMRHILWMRRANIKGTFEEEEDKNNEKWCTIAVLFQRLTKIAPPDIGRAVRQSGIWRAMAWNFG